MKADPRKVRSIFLTALERHAPEGWPVYLDETCGSEPELRQRVEILLRAHQQANSLFDIPEPSPTDPADLDQPFAELVGAVIGPYKLLQQIGEGGMGTVFMAEQTEPVRRLIALKIIKPGMDSRQVSARFEHERQALAMMDHPNIARVLDAGTIRNPKAEYRNSKQIRSTKSESEDLPPGQIPDVAVSNFGFVSDFDIRISNFSPYFVMELVKGVPITQYCDEHSLTPRERLELFLPVCHAVQHAHQKGIIHRDLKPSNILVALYDDKPVPKVIDFGVAKATGPKLTERTMFTQFGHLIGTPEYMSPEQASFNALDIDTRSDIYSLGVLLYELLTGSTPFDKKRLREAAFDEMLRIIREEEPPTPSTRLSESKETLPAVAAKRRTEPAKLGRLVKGDLDWIVMKALDKERSRRYETANELALDLQRYLRDEAVQACPPSAGYRLRKFVRRNKVSVLAAGVTTLALIAGVIGTTIGMAQANEQAQKADRAATKERQARDLADERLRHAQATITLLESVFDALDPQAEQKGGPDLKEQLLTKLDTVGVRLEREPLDPVAQARLQNALGTAFLGLGEPAKALAQFQSSFETRAAKLGRDHADTLDSMGQIAVAHLALKKLDSAIALLKETLELVKSRLGREHRYALSGMNNLAEAYREMGKPGLAIPIFEKAIKLMEAKLGPTDTNTLIAMGNLASSYRDADKIDLALSWGEKNLKLTSSVLGPDHMHTCISRENYSMACLRAGKRELGLSLLEENLDRRKKKHGPSHGATLHSMGFLGAAYRDAGKFERALPLLRETLKLETENLGPEHGETLNTMNNLAALYWSMRDLDHSIPLFEKLLARDKKTLGEDHPQTLSRAANLGVNYRDAGRLKEAIPLLEQAYQRCRKHRSLNGVGAALTSAYIRAGKTTEAAAVLLDDLAVSRKRLKANSPELIVLLAQTGAMLLETKSFSPAEPILRECLALRVKRQPDAWTTFNTQSMLGGALLGQKKYAEAEPVLLSGYKGMKERHKSIPAPAQIRVAEAVERLVRLYEALGQTSKAAEWRKKLPEGGKSKQKDEAARPAGPATETKS